MTFAELKTPGGYKCGEVASALQKCIRRGLCDDALFWAVELDLAGFGEYVFKRLVIIASEDVGLADPHACFVVSALRENWREQHKKKDAKHRPERLFLVHAILYLCSCGKSRIVDNALIVHYEGPRPRRPMPDFALDRHTLSGRALRRGWEHFFTEGTRLENEAPIPDSYQTEAVAIRSATENTQTELTLETP